MGWIYLESLVALLALVFIVWWTMRARRPDAPDTCERDDDARSTRERPKVT